MTDKKNVDARDVLIAFQNLLEKKLEAEEYRKVLLKCQSEGGTHNLQSEIDEAISKYGDSGLSQDEEY